MTNSPVDNDKDLLTIFNPIEIHKEFEEFKTQVEMKNIQYFISMKKQIYQDKDNNKNIKGIMYYFVVNRFYTRKQIEPILQNICNKLKNN